MSLGTRALGLSTPIFLFFRIEASTPACLYGMMGNNGTSLAITPWKALSHLLWLQPSLVMALAVFGGWGNNGANGANVVLALLSVKCFCLLSSAMV